MTNTADITIVRRFYEGLSAPDTISHLLSPTISFEIVPGFPYSDVYIGWDCVLRDFFGRLLQDFEDWRTEASEIFEAGARVVALGTYSARAKATGKRFAARFIHVWTLEDGVIARLQQCADTVQLARALES
jgi:ketosteroid isomerase-like protein